MFCYVLGQPSSSLLASLGGLTQSTMKDYILRRVKGVFSIFETEVSDVPMKSSQVLASIPQVK